MLQTFCYPVAAKEKFIFDYYTTQPCQNQHSFSSRNDGVNQKIATV
jgi:hypothetical protein